MSRTIVGDRMAINNERKILIDSTGVILTPGEQGKIVWEMASTMMITEN